jgi:hypothetical protein
MVVCNPWDKASQQHMAHLRQWDRQCLAALAHQVQAMAVCQTTEVHRQQWECHRLQWAWVHHQDQWAQRQPSLPQMIQIQ